MSPFPRRWTPRALYARRKRAFGAVAGATVADPGSEAGHAYQIVVVLALVVGVALVAVVVVPGQ